MGARLPGGVSRRPIARARRVNAFQGARAMSAMLHPRPAIIPQPRSLTIHPRSAASGYDRATRP